MWLLIPMDLKKVFRTCRLNLRNALQEPSPFSPKYYSHKIKASALRYEIGLGITTGHIVWAFSGYVAGDYPDLKLARELYIHQVMPQELTLADKGYQDRNYFVTPNRTNPAGHKYIMSRHESVNKRLRQFRILYKTFLHGTEKNKKCSCEHNCAHN